MISPQNIDTERKSRELLLQRYLRTRSVEDRNAFAEANIGLMKMVAGIFRKRHLGETDPSFDELIANAGDGLLLAIERFDHTRGFEFSTFAKATIYNSLVNQYLQWRRKRGMRKQPVVQHSLQELKQATDFEPVREPTYEEMSPERLAEFVRRLCRTCISQQQRDVIHLRFVDGLTLQEVGSRMGITHQRASQVEHAALDRIRKMSPEVIQRELEECRSITPPPQRSMRQPSEEATVVLPPLDREFEQFSRSLPSRAKRTVANLGVKSLDELCRCGPDKVLCQPMAGMTTLNDLRAALATIGRTLHNDVRTQ